MVSGFVGSWFWTKDHYKDRGELAGWYICRENQIRKWDKSNYSYVFVFELLYALYHYFLLLHYLGGTTERLMTAYALQIAVLHNYFAACLIITLFLGYGCINIVECNCIDIKSALKKSILDLLTSKAPRTELRLGFRFQLLY